MLGVLSSLTQSFRERSVLIIFVRWRKLPKRKPIWLGTAKSKLFRVPTRPVIPHDDRQELTFLSKTYKTKMKSLSAYFQEEAQKISAASEIAQEKSRLEDIEHERLLEENRLENERLAEARTKRMELFVKNKEERLLHFAIKAEEKLKQQLAQDEELVRREKELAKSAITADKLDAAIDEALDKIVDYNFAIDLDGNIYRGRENTAQSESLQTKSSIS